MAKKYNDETSFFNLFNAEEAFETNEETDNANDTENFVSILNTADAENEIASTEDIAEHTPMQTTMFDNENFFVEDASSMPTPEVETVVDSIATESEISVTDDTFAVEELIPEEVVEVTEEVVIEDIAEEINDVVAEEADEFIAEEATDEIDEVVAEENIEEAELVEQNLEVTPVELSIEEAATVQVEDTSFYTENNTDFEEEKMVSMLETNPLDETSPPQQEEDTAEAVYEPTIFDNLLTYNEIKKQTRAENFETPYLYPGKSSDHIRYRLQLPTKRNRKGNRFKKNMISWIITIVSAILIAIFLRTFVFVIATVDGPSMQPTLEHGERLFVTKYTYKFTDIQPGDIVICRYGTEAYPNIYVKRVIAVGGDVISISNGNVLVNNEVIDEDYILSPAIYDMDPLYVPEGSVFVMGDNRNNSADSRKTIIGPLKEDLIIGKVRFRVSPLNKFGSLED